MSSIPWFATVVHEGGIPIPYSPRMDDVVAMLLLACFLLSSYVISRNRKFLLQLVKDFLLHRERTSIFASSTAADMRCMLLLILQTCVLMGMCIFNYFSDTSPQLIQQLPSYRLLAIYIGCCTLYFFFKWLAYSFLGWIFFDEGTTTHWMESYSTLLYYVGFALFPFVLFDVYFDFSLPVSVACGLILAILVKILICFKWLKLFCSKVYGSFFLILYFCALEIVPCCILYQGMVQLNDLLIIKI